jgi:hypothetical protein
MDIQQYIELTGNSVTSETKVISQIERTQAVLEDMLGYTLDPDEVDTNEYTETGKTTSDCPCGEVGDLSDPDAVVGSYRLYTYNYNDKYLYIDPATAVHKVKLVKDGVTFKTLDATDYRLNHRRGLVQFMEQCDTWCNRYFDCETSCECVQLAVDADYVIPEDVLYLWAEMIEYYSDFNRDIKSQTLGPHSWTRNTEPPELKEHNKMNLMRYAGPNGTLYRVLT